MKLYLSNVLQNPKNIAYKRCVEVNSIEELLQANKVDNMAAQMQDGLRMQPTEERYITSNCINTDLDNGHSEDPNAWLTLDDVQDIFPDVKFYYVCSRNHLKEKRKEDKTGKVTVYAPREKYHLFFPTSKDITAAEECKKLKYDITCLFPYFDKGALDVGRLFYGVADPQGGYIDGQLCIDEYLAQYTADQLRAEQTAAVTRYNEKALVDGWQDIDPLCDYLKLPRLGSSAPAAGNKPYITADGSAPEWFYTIDRDKSEEWLKKWADNNGVQLGRRYEAILPKDNVASIFYCVECAWVDEHTENGNDDETVIYIVPSGELRYLCRHGHCTGRKWRDYKQEVERRTAANRPQEATQGPQTTAAVTADKLHPCTDEALQEAVESAYNAAVETWTDTQPIYASGDPQPFCDYLYEFYTDKFIKRVSDAVEIDEATHIRMHDAMYEASEKYQDPREVPTAADIFPWIYPAQPEDPPKIDCLDSFWEKIQTESYKPYCTGINFFDDLLDGGVIKQTLLLLLAAPSTGKTTLCLQIAEQMAAIQKPVVYLNFEMSQEQLLAKNISYKLAREYNTFVSATEILQGYKWTDTEKAKIKIAIDDYRKEIYPYLQCNPAGASSDLGKLLEYLHSIGEASKQAGREAPAVFVDYLHLITSADMEPQELIKQAVVGLKQYAIDYNTFVVGIVATNRESNKKGQLSMESGRDSSNLEYTADYQITLNYTEVDNGKVDPQKDKDELAKLQQASERSMILRLTKNRMGVQGKKAIVKFKAAYNIFLADGEASEPTIPFAETSENNSRI